MQRSGEQSVTNCRDLYGRVDRYDALHRPLRLQDTLLEAEVSAGQVALRYGGGQQSPTYRCVAAIIRKVITVKQLLVNSFMIQINCV